MLTSLWGGRGEARALFLEEGSFGKEGEEPKPTEPLDPNSGRPCEPGYRIWMGSF